MPFLRASFLLAFVVTAAAACSAGNGTPTGGTGGTGTGTGTGGPSGGSGGGSGGDAPVTKGGSIYVSSAKIDTTSYYSVSASFYDHTGIDTSAGPGSCQRTDEGACTLYICDISGTLPNNGPLPTAGSIKVSSSKTSVTIAPGADGSYASKSGQTLFWTGSDTVHVEASGAQIPAFSASTPAPSQLAITAPPMGPMVTITVDTSKDLTFTWTGTSAGQLNVGVYGHDDVTHIAGSLNCELDPAAGQGSMPASLLSKIPKKNGAVNALVTSKTSVDAGGFAIDVIASTLATAKGQAAQVLVQFK